MNNNKHPLYADHIEDWQLCRDSYIGERVVKNKGTLYLPATPSQIEDGMLGEGLKQYTAYKARSVFPDYLKAAVETYIGAMWDKPPTIEVPAAMESIIDNATVHGESLAQLLRKINEQQLVTGRCGLLLDMPVTPKDNPTPYIALYNSESIINWDKDGTFFVLDESDYVRQDNFSWNRVEKYRVLEIKDGVYTVSIMANEDAQQGQIEPTIRGSVFDSVPFSIINSKDVIPTPDMPPLLGLAKLAMTIYRGEADYRQSLFLQGQDTLVITGGNADVDEVIKVGAGAKISIPLGGKAEFIGVSSDGLAEQRQALENDKAQAAQIAGQLVDNRSRQKESGEAMSTRLSAQTATLNQIAQAGGEGLKRVLKNCAIWMGANPDEVIVEPNLDFTFGTMDSRTLLELMTAKGMGAPISMESIHKQMQDKDLTDFTYEEELEKMEDETQVIL